MGSIDDELGGPPTNPSPATVIPVTRGLSTGQVLAGRYEIIARLGEGGMGAVFRAHDRELGEDIALKVILPERLNDPGALERLRRELKIARKITHPNVCRVFDLGEDAGLRFLTMELIEGRSLRDVLLEGPLPPDHAVALLRQIIAGVAAAHAQGVIHRDLKPDNVLLRDDGRAVVVDFGLARGHAVDHRSTTAFAGTPAYMSPEQLRGEPLDGRSDIFAIGIMAYELFSGKLPFGDGAPATIASAILRDPPAPLELPAAPAGERRAIEDVIGKALAKDPGERFATVGELDAALRTLAPARSEAAAGRGDNAPVAPPIAPQETQREAVVPTRAEESPRRAARALWIALACLLVAAVGAGVAQRLSSPKTEPFVTESPPPSEQPAARPPEAGEKPAIAVLDFQNLTGDPSLEGLGRAAPEAIRSTLRTAPELRLIDDLPADAPEARARGITWLVKGSVQRLGPSLRLTAQYRPLAEAPSGEPIEVDGDAADPAKLLDALRLRALDEARLLRRFEERRRWIARGTTNDAARAKLIEYEALVGARPRSEHFEAGMRLLDEAIGADASYVPAIVERAFLRSIGAGKGTEQERMEASLVDIDRAVELAPRDPDVLVMRCRIKQLVIELGAYPTDAIIKAATDACDAALIAAPRSPFVHRAIGRIHDRRCEDGEAIGALDRAYELDRTALGGSLIRYLVGLLIQNDRLIQADRMSEALVAVQEEEKRLGPRAFTRRAGNAPIQGAHLYRAAVLMRLGRAEEAWTELVREQEDAAASPSGTWYEAAAIRGLMALAPRLRRRAPPGLEQRIVGLESDFRAAIEKNPSLRKTVASAYDLTDSRAALAWLDGSEAPATCKDVFFRASYYRGAGEYVAGRRALDDCKPVEAWERSCFAYFASRLSR